MLAECYHREDACSILTGTELKKRLRAVSESFCFGSGLTKNESPGERYTLRPWNGCKKQWEAEFW